MSLYDDLGVPKDASPDEIKKAHRRQVKKHHPDAGGDVEKFGALQKAFEVLSDDARRERYDQSGDTDDRFFDREQAELMTMVSSVLSAVINNPDLDLDHTDLATMLRKHLDTVRAQIEQQKMAAIDRVKRMEKMRRKFKRRKGKKHKAVPPMIDTILDGSIRAAKAEVIAKDEALDKHTKVEAVFEAYDYDFTPAPPPERSPYDRFHEMGGPPFSTTNFFKS